MGYELLDDVQTVVLGGTDKKTGKKNPTEIEGYFLRVETRPNRFNLSKPQNYYIFQTQDGERGVYGKAGVDREMKKATPGAMIKLVNTGKVLDTGKGNPMTIFKAWQDKDNKIDVETASAVNSSFEDTSTDEPIEETDLEAEEIDSYSLPSTPPARVTARSTLKAPDPERQARVQALLGKK